MSGEPTQGNEANVQPEALEEKAHVKESDAVVGQAEYQEEGIISAVELSGRRRKCVNTPCTNDRKSDGNVNTSLLDTTSSSPNVIHYSNCPPSSPDKESRTRDRCTKIWYPKSSVTNDPNQLDFQNQDSCTTERCETVGKTDNNLNERSFNSSCSTETESHVLNFNESSKHEDINVSQGGCAGNTDSKHVLNITKDITSTALTTNATDKKCKETLPIDQYLNNIVDKQKLPDKRIISTLSVTRLEGQMITSHPNKDLINHGCHPTKEQLLDGTKKLLHDRKIASNHAHLIESENKCTEQSADIRKAHNKNSITLSNQIAETLNSTNDVMSTAPSIEKHGNTILIVTDSRDNIDKRHENVHENDCNSRPDKELLQIDGVGGNARNDDVICDKKYANNRELCDANVLLSSKPRLDSAGNPNDSNDDLLDAHGKISTTSSAHGASNSHLNEIIPRREDASRNNSHEKTTKIICDKSHTLLSHSSGAKQVAKEPVKETAASNNTKYQKNSMGFLTYFKSHKKEKGMRNCKSLVFDSMESEDLLKDQHMAGSYGNLRRPTIMPSGNQRRRCISSSYENENKRYVALHNGSQDDIDEEQGPNSPISNSKKTISLSTITLTKLRNNNHKIQRKIDTILSKSWRSLLTVQNSRSPHVSTQDISDGSRSKSFYRNPYGTRSVMNVNSKIIYKQPAYSKSWTEISGCISEPRKKNFGHYASNVFRLGPAPMSPLGSTSSDEAVRESPMPRVRCRASSSGSNVSVDPQSGSFSSEPLKPVNRLRVPSLCEDGVPSKMCSRCSSLLSMAASSKYSVSSLAGYVSVAVPAPCAEPVASVSGSSGVVLCKVCLLEVPYKDSWTLSDCHCSYCLEVRTLFSLLLLCLLRIF